MSDTDVLSMFPQINSFFEFNERLEAILTKAYIYRSALAKPTFSLSIGLPSTSSHIDIYILCVSQGDSYHHLPSLLSPLQRLSVLLGFCLQRTRNHQVGVRWQRQQVNIQHDSVTSNNSAHKTIHCTQAGLFSG